MGGNQKQEQQQIRLAPVADVAHDEQAKHAGVSATAWADADSSSSKGRDAYPEFHHRPMAASLATSLCHERRQR